VIPRDAVVGVTQHGLRTADYEFDLPPDRIAQYPISPRDASRLMVVDRQSQRISHRQFRDLADLIPAGDVLVLNTSRVMRARLIGTRANGALAEVLLLKPHAEDSAVSASAGAESGAEARVWEAMVHPGGKLRPGRRVHIGPGVDVVIDAITPQRTRLVHFDSALSADEIMAHYGHVPLPPYIARADSADDAERYQTVYARAPGSVAAPTAGLHFTDDLLGALEAKGVVRVDAVLHVGAGTFRPVEADDPGEHAMHAEHFVLGADAAAALNAARLSGRHIWAVGSTAMRILETAIRDGDTFEPASGVTRIFIRPPHRVRGADRLVTNFHLPRSTLIMLVAAFAGYDLTMQAYRAAIEEGYRFYSYGDAMCIV
jgi:S-adenosylmethionine:tRNA ribosyltransferase-isomerase